jgi:hypothetical protein
MNVAVLLSRPAKTTKRHIPDLGIWRFVTLLGNAQLRLLGIRLSGFAGFADGA